jgi:hypothetical protein
MFLPFFLSATVTAHDLINSYQGLFYCHSLSLNPLSQLPEFYFQSGNVTMPTLKGPLENMRLIPTQVSQPLPRVPVPCGLAQRCVVLKTLILELYSPTFRLKAK